MYYRCCPPLGSMLERTWNRSGLWSVAGIGDRLHKTNMIAENGNKQLRHNLSSIDRSTKNMRIDVFAALMETELQNLRLNFVEQNMTFHGKSQEKLLNKTATSAHTDTKNMIKLRKSWNDLKAKRSLHGMENKRKDMIQHFNEWRKIYEYEDVELKLSQVSKLNSIGKSAGPNGYWRFVIKQFCDSESQRLQALISTSTDE